MTDDRVGEVTTLLREIQGGNKAAKDELFVLVLDELHRLAETFMRRERLDHTLQPTALVNEIYLRLINSNVFDRAETRRYFFGAVIRAMGQFLREYARRQPSPGSMVRMPSEEVLDAIPQQHVDLSDLYEALDQLEELSPRQYEVVALRYFGGWKMYEIAKLLEISEAAVHNDYRAARAFLRGQLRKG
jgi:RNA polymerase sigma factor (TIGR02999 family)